MNRKGAMSVSLKLMMFALAIVIFFSLLTLTQKDLVYNILAPAHNLLQQGEQTVDDIEPVQPSNGGSGTGSSGSGSGSTGGPSSDIAGGPGAIGGGEAYENKLCSTPSGAETVESGSAFRDALGSSDTIWIPGDAEITVDGNDITVPSGTTIASNRGCSGSDGAILRMGAEDNTWLKVQDNVRITGLTIRGPYYEEMQDNNMMGRGSDIWARSVTGLSLEGSTIEIDNNDIAGFSYEAIAPDGEDITIHHNSIHHNSMSGLGYGISVGTSDMVMIEYNYFNFNRHSIAGPSSASYEARYNIHGPDMPGHHAFDIHGSEDTCGQHCGGQAGVEFRIHHNTFQATDDSAVSIRGVPQEESSVTNNWFYHTQDDNPVIQEKDTDFENMVVENNHYGESEPDSCDIGAPRESCSTSTNTANNEQQGDISTESCSLPAEAIVMSGFENGPMEPFNDGNGDNLQTVTANAYDSSSLKVRIPEGEHLGTGAGFIFSEAGMDEPEELYAQYLIRFGENWDPGSGWTGKLPGFAGTYDEAGWGGRRSNGHNGWSARGGFSRGDSGTEIGFYTYHVDMGTWGSPYLGGDLQNGEWYCVKQHITLNTPGENDGILAMWVDGEQIVNRDDIRWRDTADLKIRRYWFDIYYGGSATAPHDMNIYFDNVAISRTPLVSGTS